MQAQDSRTGNRTGNLGRDKLAKWEVLDEEKVRRPKKGLLENEKDQWIVATGNEHIGE